MPLAYGVGGVVLDFEQLWESGFVEGEAVCSLDVDEVIDGVVDGIPPGHHPVDGKAND